MSRLISRQSQIPNGFRFALPELKWQSGTFQSFDTIVNQATTLIQSNPQLAKEKGWPTSREEIANWVDAYNASICEGMGWRQFIIGSDGGAFPEPPKQTPLSDSLKNVAAGAKALTDWIGTGAPCSPKELAQERAAVCVKCPVMQKGDLGNFFTRAASEIIRLQIQTAQDLDLTTKYDSQLGVCGACSCPMRLKVFVALKPILENILPEAKANLDPACWILAEEKGTTGPVTQ